MPQGGNQGKMSCRLFVFEQHLFTLNPGLDGGLEHQVF